MLIATKNTIVSSRFLDGELLKQINSMKCLGVHIDRNLSWNMHVHVISRLSQIEPVEQGI